MNNDELLELLSKTLKDDRLDQQEKSQLLDTFAPLDEEQRAFIRNRAFDLLSVSFNETGLSQKGKWLFKILKVLDQSRPASASIKSFFSPGDECKNALIGQIKKTKRSIDVCVFTISDNDISDALIQTHKRGVRVRVLTDNDKQFDLGSDIARLCRGGIKVKTDRSRHHMHHKFAVFDDDTLVTGSFNWTRSASDYNHENIMIVQDEVSVAAFLLEFEALWSEFGEDPSS